MVYVCMERGLCGECAPPCVLTRVEAGGQWGIFSATLYLIFDPAFLTEPEPWILGRLTGQQAPGIHPASTENDWHTASTTTFSCGNASPNASVAGAPHTEPLSRPSRRKF